MVCYNCYSYLTNKPVSSMAQLYSKRPNAMENSVIAFQVHRDENGVYHSVVHAAGKRCDRDTCAYSCFFFDKHLLLGYSRNGNLSHSIQCCISWPFCTYANSFSENLL